MQDPYKACTDPCECLTTFPKQYGTVLVVGVAQQVEQSWDMLCKHSHYAQQFLNGFLTLGLTRAQVPSADGLVKSLGTAKLCLHHGPF